MPNPSEEIQQVEAYERCDTAIVARRTSVLQAESIHNTYNIIHIHHGSYYLNTKIVNSGKATSILGNPKSMSPGVRATRSQKTHQKSNPFSTSPSSLNEAQAEIEAEPEIEVEVQIEAEAETAIDMTDAEGSEADTSYIERERDFFKAGLLFKVAKEGDPLHLNQYILLDKNYNDGPCLQVFTYDGSNPMLGEANFLRSHVEVQTHDSKPPEDDGSEDSGKRRRIVYLDEYSAAKENTYVKLAWTANIPFEGYRYKDCGELDRRYLRELRSSYADWLKYYWDLD